MTLQNHDIEKYEKLEKYEESEKNGEPDKYEKSKENEESEKNKGIKIKNPDNIFNERLSKYSSSIDRNAYRSEDSTRLHLRFLLDYPIIMNQNQGDIHIRKRHKCRRSKCKINSDNIYMCFGIPCQGKHNQKWSLEINNRNPLYVNIKVLEKIPECDLEPIMIEAIKKNFTKLFLRQAIAKNDLDELSDYALESLKTWCSL